MHLPPCPCYSKIAVSSPKFAPINYTKSAWMTTKSLETLHVYIYRARLKWVYFKGKILTHQFHIEEPFIVNGCFLEAYTMRRHAHMKGTNVDVC